MVGALQVSQGLFQWYCTYVDLKLQLSATDYGSFLQNEPSPISTATLAARCTERMVQEFQYLRAHADEPLSKFLDYITFVLSML